METDGVMRDGVRWFPAARPIKMLRIFRQKFEALESAQAEMRTFKILARHLPVATYAASSEFLADYWVGSRYSAVLCGLQEYVTGQILDLWQLPTDGGLQRLHSSMQAATGGDAPLAARQWLEQVQSSGAALVKGLKAMILQAGHVPDLAGYGNLLVTARGQVKLVDINNISPVEFAVQIPLDDKGYPVCDKSIEALALMEQKLLQRPIDMHEKQYRWFLDPQRMREVATRERAFNARLDHRTLEHNA